jgi:hypothetical protein
VTINAPNGGRVMHITSGAATVNLLHLDIEGGEPSEDDQALGGGIFSNATNLLTLTDVTVANNIVTATGVTTGNTSASGGGVYSSGPLLLDHSRVTENTAIADNPLATDGEAIVQGGGVLSGGDTQVIDSSIDGNTGQATDEQGSALGNAARVFGAGLAGGVPLEITRSSIINNTAAPTSVEGAAFAWGGGIEIFAPPVGSATIELSTIASNITDPAGVDAPNSIQDGGGMVDFGVSSITLQSDTIAGNGPQTGNDNNANLAPAFSGSTYTLKNTIVADPRGATSSNCDGAVTSAGFNIDSGTSCGLDPGTTPSDHEGANPLLNPLDDNGGPTETRSPQPGSPAIDAGRAVGQTDATHDERGLTRPVNSPTVTDAVGGDGSDIGAVEAQAPPAPTVTGTTPTSPTVNDTSPEVLGTTSPGPGGDEDPTSVRIFSDSGCATVASLSPGTPTDFSTTGITAIAGFNATTTFYANASNDYGITSPCSSTFAAYKHDSLGPVMTIDSGPSDSSDHTPSFTFHATDASPPVAYECSVDTGTASFTPCTSPFTSSSLADGSYTFRVQGEDAQGTGGAPTSQGFTITTPTTPPSVTTPTPTPTPTPAPKKKKCKKAKKGSASAAKKCKKKK